MMAGLGVSEQQAEKLVEKLFVLSAWRDLEMWISPRLNKQEMQDLVEFRGMNNLKKALDRGKGAILCTGHLRSLITFFVAMGLEGYKINAVRRSALKVQGPVGRWLVKQRTLVGSPGVNFFWMNATNLKAAVQVGNALRRNEIVVFLIDVRYGAETVPVDFLHEKKQFPSGHVTMSQVTGAPLIDFYASHPGEGFRRVVEFGEPFYPSSDLVAGVQRTFTHLEEQIVQNPADWLWFPERELWKNPAE
jgi:Kdo2-lipid IVA lauroyltransferase/acyltransferase